MTLFNDKAIKYVPRLMKDLDISHINACGIFGNLGTETGGFTALQEKKPTVAGSKGGYGWMQWTGLRRRKYEAWCSENGLKGYDDDTNYKYLIKESLTEEYNSIKLLRKTTTIEASTETFMLKNLRPGVPHLDNRINWAHKAYDATKGTSRLEDTTSNGGLPPSKPNNVPNVSNSNIDTNKPNISVSPQVPNSVKTIGVLGTLGAFLASFTLSDWLLYGAIGSIATVVAGYILIKYIQWRHGQTK